jgi:glycyl-tRNA synthetase
MSYNEILRLALERGFFFPTAEIYSNTPAGLWDYGPLGVKLRERFVELWRKEVVRRDDMIEVDGALIMPRDVFVASGHLESFVDPVVQCKACRAVIRADRYINERTGLQVPERAPEAEMDRMISEHGLRCPTCGGELGNVSKFNMMFSLNVGISGETAYLRPETAQSIFVSFQRVYRVMRLKLPVGLAQFGKSFRNEISPRQSLMRMREFYQAEAEIFFNPEKANLFNKFETFKDFKINICKKEKNGGNSWKTSSLTCLEALESGILPNKLVAYYLALIGRFYEVAGVDPSNIRFRVLGDDERAFYAEAAYDLEVKTSLGWIELVACNYRTDYDISRHAAVSKQDLSVVDDGKKIIPHVFELSMGVDRSLYVVLEQSFQREDERDVLRIKQYLCPVQLGVFPLVTKDGLPEYALEVYGHLKLDFDCYYDDSGSIGRRYRRADEVGVPVCLTVDYQSLRDDTVTLRDRDTMGQIRLGRDKVYMFLKDFLGGKSFGDVAKELGAVWIK